MELNKVIKKYFYQQNNEPKWGNSSVHCKIIMKKIKSKREPRVLTAI